MLTTLKRKPYQRRINAAVRKMNKQLEQDDFLRKHCDVYISQTQSYFWRYEDKSGATMNVILCITDRVTGAQSRQCFCFRDFYNGWSWYYWEWVNNFILKLRKKGDW